MELVFNSDHCKKVHVLKISKILKLNLIMCVEFVRNRFSYVSVNCNCFSKYLKNFHVFCEIRTL